MLLRSSGRSATEMACAISSPVSKASSIVVFQRSAQMCLPVSASSSCTEIRTRSPSLRRLPTTRYSAPSSVPTRTGSTIRPLYVNVELRAITGNWCHIARFVMRSSVMPSARYSASPSPSAVSNGRTAIAGQRGALRPGGQLLALHVDEERVDRVRDVLDELRADVLERRGVLELHSNKLGDTDAARSCKTLETRGDVDPGAVDPVAVHDDLAAVHSHPELHPVLGRVPLVRLEHERLEPKGRVERGHSAAELEQEVVTGRVHEPAVVLVRDLLGRLAEDLDRLDRGQLVDGHEPAVPRGIGAHQRGAPALDRGQRHRRTRCPVTQRSLLHAHGGRQRRTCSRSPAGT